MNVKASSTETLFFDPFGAKISAMGYVGCILKSEQTSSLSGRGMKQKGLTI
jgi:hypothetical protein